MFEKVTKGENQEVFDEHRERDTNKHKWYVHINRVTNSDKR